MPGLETGVMGDTDGLVSQLYRWTEGTEVGAVIILDILVNIN